jgi:hypothetical protein
MNISAEVLLSKKKNKVTHMQIEKAFFNETIIEQTMDQVKTTNLLGK